MPSPATRDPGSAGPQVPGQSLFMAVSPGTHHHPAPGTSHHSRVVMDAVSHPGTTTIPPRGTLSRQPFPGFFQPERPGLIADSPIPVRPGALQTIPLYFLSAEAGFLTGVYQTG